MTIDELRSFPNCQDYTDEQASNIVQTLEKLAVILFDFTCQQNGMIIDNQVVIKEIEENNLKLAA